MSDTHSLAANAIRMLTVDAVQRAKSGHPGAPMGMADIATVLWQQFYQHNPANPGWVNRDRFVLSNGHGSMLQYALLHLSGYAVSIDDIKQFRQLHSNTPGHPEYGYTPGVETTTGPLGAGIANAVGMAIAEKTLAAQFNRAEFSVVDHFTYCFLGDGCLMEGISHEVCSLAGTLKLGKLIAFWDDNGISIDGHVEGWFSDDTVKRFQAYGWQVIADVDGHNPDAIANAIAQAQAETTRPTLICCKTTIGFGSPNKSGSHDCHGAPLGEDEIALVRKQLNWPYAPFDIPQGVYQQWDAKPKGLQREADWLALLEQYTNTYPELASVFRRRVMDRELPADFAQKSAEYVSACQQSGADIATRKASQNTIGHYAALLPELMGGSADLAGSNLTLWPDARGIQDDPAGNYIFYGVREFGMSAIMNGIALHGGFIPYGGTFLMFMEYARNAVRMAALMKVPSIFVYTHDSIGQGEDGPTHQPIEQLANLRMTPQLETWRPCDAVETAEAWRQAIMRQQGPSALVFSRQNTLAQQRLDEQVESIQKGGYVLVEPDTQAQLIIIATGSEVSIAVSSATTLAEQGVAVRVVSMPCTERFDAQDAGYRASVLPAGTPKLAIEAAHKDFWYKYVGTEGAIIGMDRFGESAPGGVLLTHFGFTPDNAVNTALALLAKTSGSQYE
ncbi:transketolase [Aestuariibacter sp. GS-14]|uniref:transketolase n=1 Tax=Aestuariibacter sp. GS-14 TaxID=2590670 RepID=UPI001127E848|nr:transketolase [Aestuariibacter sp. GS-14]TPV56449.1 transketolase [Aestuariibacter sp. GS-14]